MKSVYENSRFAAHSSSADLNDSTDSYEDIYANEDVIEMQVTRSNKEAMTSGTYTHIYTQTTSPDNSPKDYYTMVCRLYI